MTHLILLWRNCSVRPPFCKSNIKTMLISEGMSKTCDDVFKTSCLCFVRKGSHSWWNCSEFGKKSVEKQQKLVKEKSMF